MRKGFELTEKAVELEPEEPGEYQMLGMLNLSRGDYDSAIAFREKALKLAPNDFVVVFLQCIYKSKVLPTLESPDNPKVQESGASLLAVHGMVRQESRHFGMSKV
jgi:tetratricopeptide (TPR) repeat protein